MSTRSEFIEERDRALAQRAWAEEVLSAWEPTLDGVSNHGTYFSRTFVKAGHREAVEAPCTPNGGATLATAQVLAGWSPSNSVEA